MHVRGALSLEELFSGFRGGRQRLPGRPAAYLPLEGLQLPQGYLIHPNISHANPPGRVHHDATDNQRLRLAEHRNTKQDRPGESEKLAAFHVFINLLGDLNVRAQSHHPARYTQTVCHPDKHRQRRDPGGTLGRGPTEG